MLGFELDAWDYATFVVLFLLVLSALIFLVWLAGLPGRIAIPQTSRRRGGQDDGLRRFPRGGAVDSGVHLGVQAHRHRGHPALPGAGGEGH